MRFIEFLKSFGGGLGISGRVNVNPSRIPRRLIALDEVLINGLDYWVYAVVDVDRNEVLSMRVYPSRNILTTKQFILKL